MAYGPLLPNKLIDRSSFCSQIDLRAACIFTRMQKLSVSQFNLGHRTDNRKSNGKKLKVKAMHAENIRVTAKSPIADGHVA